MTRITRIHQIKIPLIQTGRLQTRALLHLIKIHSPQTKIPLQQGAIPLLLIKIHPIQAPAAEITRRLSFLIKKEVVL